MSQNTISYHLRIDPHKIGLLNMDLEGLEGVAVMRTLDPERGIIKIWVAPGLEDEFLALMESLRAEYAWEWLSSSSGIT